MLTVDFQRLDVRPGHRLLDLGCGAGRHTYEARRRGATVVSLDRDGDVLAGVTTMVDAMVAQGELAGAPGGALRADARALPFADGSFDRVVAAEVLEHVPDDDPAIDELVRVLAPGGRLAVTVPARRPEQLCWALDPAYHRAPGGHVRIYHRRGLEAKLWRAGLVVRGGHRAHAFHTPYWWLRCAVGVEHDDHALVRAYHRFLVWDITHRPRWTAAVEHALDPVLGKSLVLYADKPPAVDRAPARGRTRAG